MDLKDSREGCKGGFGRSEERNYKLIIIIKTKNILWSER